jgi:hypothetical protein
MLGPRAGDDAPVARADLQRDDVRTEASIAVMVFAMYVGGNHPADRDKPRAGRDWRKEATGQEQTADVVERYTRFYDEQTISGIEGEDSVRQGRPGYGEVSGRGQRGVAVGAAQAPCERQVTREPLEVLRPEFHARNYRDPAPAGQLGCLHSDRGVSHTEAGTKKKAASSLKQPQKEIIPAVTYSPTHLRMQYHRRWQA